MRILLFSLRSILIGSVLPLQAQAQPHLRMRRRFPRRSCRIIPNRIAPGLNWAWSAPPPSTIGLDRLANTARVS